MDLKEWGSLLIDSDDYINVWALQVYHYVLTAAGPPTWVMSLLAFASGEDRWKRSSTARNSLPTEHMACVTVTKPPVPKSTE